ncbi:MAG: trypsin-like peptidase domain-containing protein [Candidatus Krumholzibacteriia bacterium]
MDRRLGEVSACLVVFLAASVVADPPAAGSARRETALVAAGGADLQKRIFAARDRVLPALVNVQPVVRDFSSGTKEKSRVTGSGVVIRAAGYVVTNYHVAGQSEDVICTLWNKERLRARLVGGDPLTDLAVLKLDYSEYEAERPPAATFGDSDLLQTGQLVMALGSPFALSRSLSFGVISTTDRYLSADFRLPSGERTGIFNTWIQTDAAINPGNSGGPLVDLSGRVIGINSRAFVLANNLGFSIPSNVVEEVVDAIIDKGHVERSWIGVEVQPLQELEDVFAADQGGALVSDVEADSPAEQAGIRAGDLLLRVGKHEVSARFYEEIPTFYKTVADLEPGEEIDVEFQRGGVIHSRELTTQEYGRSSGTDFEVKAWGFAVRGITKQMALDRRLDDLRGVLVAGVKGGASAEAAGLGPNDVVRFVDETPIENLESFQEIYEDLVGQKKTRVMLNVKRRDSSRYVLLKLDFEEG